MQKGFLIAGGLLILGFLGYTLFGKKEEEQVEDAEYYIVVETDTTEAKRQEKKQESESLASEEPIRTGIPVVKGEGTAIEGKPIVTTSKNDKQPIIFPKKIQVSDHKVASQQTLAVNTNQTDPKQEKKQSDLEVVKPQEFIVEANDEFPLKLGSKGQRVWDLKVYLMKNHGVAGIITNDFDRETAERVHRFLKVDEVSKQLYNKLNIGQPRKKKRNATKKKH